MKRAVGAGYAGGRWLMVGSGASRRSGRCERDLRACTSVTRVARETCALGKALKTSRKVSRTGCSAQRRRSDGAESVATASQARRWSERLVQSKRAARSCRRRPAARRARDAQGKMEGDEANGAGNAGTRAQIWQRLRAAAGAGVVELAAAAGASERGGRGGRCSGCTQRAAAVGAGAGASSWNTQRNSRRAASGHRSSAVQCASDYRGDLTATTVMDDEVRAMGTAPPGGCCWLERSIKSICLGNASVQWDTTQAAAPPELRSWNLYSTCLPSIIHLLAPSKLFAACTKVPTRQRCHCECASATRVWVLKPHGCLNVP